MDCRFLHTVSYGALWSFAQGQGYSQRQEILTFVPRVGKEGQAGLMRGQKSFWVKYPAWGLHVKHTPPGKQWDSTVSDKINNAGLIRTNRRRRPAVSSKNKRSKGNLHICCYCFEINLFLRTVLSSAVRAVVVATNKD